MSIKLPFSKIAILFFAVSVSASNAWSSDSMSQQEAAKNALETQLLAEISSQLNVTKSRITVHISDRRLRVPVCDEAFSVSFPFSDRSTVQVSCDSQQWTKYIRVSLGPYRSIMVFRRNMTEGEIIRRGDIKFIDSMSFGQDVSEFVTAIDQVINRTLRKAVEIDEPVRLDNFADSSGRLDDDVEPMNNQVLVALTTINRGTRLNDSLFGVEVRRGRLPSDKIEKSADLKFLQANRVITAGDILRRSIVSLAPAVRKDDLVEIVIQRGVLSVTATVRAMSDGSIGDVIEVVNVESGRAVRATVIDVGSLEII